MSQIDLALVFVFWSVDVQEESHHLGATGAELERLARLSLRDAPQFRVVERTMLDLVDDMRPAPSGVDFVEQRARRIVQPRRGGLLGLQVISFEPGPALQRIVVPRTACEVFVNVEVAVGNDIEARAFLVADQHCQGILKFLAEANVLHAGIQGATPHAYVKPAWAWKRSGGGAGEN